MASQSKTKTVKFEVGQFVLFSDHRVGQVSRIAKNGAIYVIVLGETTVADQTREELRVKKADLQLIEESEVDAVSVEDYIRQVIRDNISCGVSANAKRADDGAYELAPDYIPSPGCLAYCEWEGSKAAQSVMHYVGIDLVKLANLYTGKKAEVVEAIQSSEDAAQQAAVDSAPMVEPIQSTLFPEYGEFMGERIQFAPPAAAVALADATYALRELTFSVTRHSILTAFIDVALNKDITGYHHPVASNIKNLMAAAFDPVHDSVGYARINTWTMAALELVVKNKARVAKMLNQPIEAAPIKIDRVTKLGMWIDNMMNRNGPQVNDMTSAYDSCYVYDAMGKTLEACAFAVVEVVQAMDNSLIGVLPIPPAFGQGFCEHLTAQSAISVRKQYIDYWRQLEPGLSSYCGIVPILKTGLSMRAAIDEAMASAIGSLK